MNTLILPVKSNLRPKTSIKSSQVLEHHDIVAASHLLTAISYGLNIDEESIMVECSHQFLTLLNQSIFENQLTNPDPTTPEPGGTVDDPANEEEDEDKPGGEMPEAPETGGTVDDPANEEEDEDKPGGEMPEAEC